MKHFLIQLATDLFFVWPLIFISLFISSDYQIYAENLLSFLGVFYLAIGTIGIFSIDKVAESVFSKGETRIKLHTNFSIATSVVEIGIFASAGWYWVAAGWCVGLIASANLHSKVRELHEKV